LELLERGLYPGATVPFAGELRTQELGLGGAQGTIIQTM
jgi:hypothetical protein